MPLKAENCFKSIVVSPDQYPKVPKTSQLGNWSYRPKSNIAAGYIEIYLLVVGYVLSNHYVVADLMMKYGVICRCNRMNV